MGIFGDAFHAVTHPADTLHDVGHAITHPADTAGSVLHTAGNIVTHPLDTAATVGRAAVDPVGAATHMVGIPNPLGNLNPVDHFFNSGPDALGKVFSDPVGSIGGITGAGHGIGGIASGLGGITGAGHGIGGVAGGLGGITGAGHGLGDLIADGVHGVGGVPGAASGIANVDHGLGGITGAMGHGGVGLGGIMDMATGGSAGASADHIAGNPGGFFQHDIENRLGVPLSQFQHDPNVAIADHMGQLMHQPLGAFAADPGVFVAHNIGYSAHIPLGDLVADPQGFFTHNLGYSMGLPLTDFAHDPNGTFMHAFSGMAGGPGLAPEHPVGHVPSDDETLGSTSAALSRGADMPNNGAFGGPGPVPGQPLGHSAAALSHGVDMPLVGHDWTPSPSTVAPEGFHSWVGGHGGVANEWTPSSGHGNCWVPVSHMAAQTGTPLPPWLDHVSHAPVYAVPSPWDAGPGGSWGANPNHPLHHGFNGDGWYTRQVDTDHDGHLASYDEFADRDHDGIADFKEADGHAYANDYADQSHDRFDHDTVIDHPNGHDSGPAYGHDNVGSHGHDDGQSFGHDAWANPTSNGADADEFANHADHSADDYSSMAYQESDHDSHHDHHDDNDHDSHHDSAPMPEAESHDDDSDDDFN